MTKEERRRLIRSRFLSKGGKIFPSGEAQLKSSDPYPVRGWFGFGRYGEQHFVPSPQWVEQPDKRLPVTVKPKRKHQPSPLTTMIPKLLAKPKREV